jgi:tetratricopeptide (TPR) repeat protein
MPDDIPIKRRLLDCGQATNRIGNLQSLVDEIKSIEGQDGWQWRYEQARLWFAEDSFRELYPQIVLLLRENLLLNPDDQASHRLLAANYERAGELQLAVSAYREILSRSPDDVELIVSTVTAMYKAGEYDRADSILAQAARQKLLDPRLSKLELYSYVRQGKLNPAGDILEQFLARMPEDNNMRLSLALLRMQQNRLDEASELLNQLLQNDPDSLLVTAQLAELNLRQGKDDEALELCDKMVNRFNNAPAYLLRGRTYAGLGRMSLAKEDMEKAVAMEPDGLRTLMFKSQIHQSMGELTEAVRTIRRAAAIAPEDYQVQKQAALIFLASQDEQTKRQGGEFLNKALALNPNDAQLWLYKAQMLLSEGTAPSVEQAVSILKKVTTRQPKVPQAWAMLAGLYLEQDKPAQAMDLALRGLSYLPNDKMLMLAKAHCEAARSPILAIPTLNCEAARSPILAIPTLKALSDTYPDDADVVIPLAETYVMAGQHPKAVELLKSQLASAKGADARKMNIALAVALYENSDIEQAREKFAILYKEQPDDPATVLAHSLVLKKHRRWAELAEIALGWYKSHPQDITTLLSIVQDLAMSQENQAKKVAEDILRTIIDNDSDCVDALSSLAVLMHMSGRSVAAVDLYEKVLKLDPDRLTALNNLAWILCQEQDKCEQSLELVRRGLAKNPNYIDMIDTSGMVHYRLGQYEKAVEDFTKCIKLYHSGASAVVGSYFHLGRALQRLGQENEAISNLKKSLDLNVRIGGLSPAEAAEARQLLAEISEKPNYVPITN